LEEGDYPSAVKEFTQSLRLGEDTGDTAELLRIAKDLQERQRSKPSEKGPPTASNPSPKPKPAPPKPAPPKAAPKRPTPAKSAEDDEPARGLILVTSTPPGLVIELDGRRVDLTPARISAEPGLHTVVLSRGDQRLYDRRLEVEEGEVHSIDADLTEKLRPVGPPVAVAVPVSSESPRLSEPVSPSATKTRAAEAGGPPPVKARAAEPETKPVVGPTGELQIFSLNVYGEVWINDRPYGFPPQVAKELPAGPARVEIRVGGAVRRTKVAEVVPSRRTTLRIR
jgi:hypothetical protein